MKRLLFLFIALCGAATLYGQPKARIIQSPYIQQATSDGFTVVWTTDSDAAAWVEVAPNDGTHFYATERPKYFQSQMGRRLIGRHHAVRVEGLQPGITYRYRVMQQAFARDPKKGKLIPGDSGGSDVYRGTPYLATTLDPSKKQVEFWMVNDIHGNDSLMNILLDGARKGGADFICLNGDMTSTIDSEEQLTKGYLSSMSKISTTTGLPFFFVRGNHEGRGLLSAEYLDLFPTSTGEPYYAFREGPAFFVCLDGGEDKPDSDIAYQGLGVSDAYRAKQAAWLREVVKSEAFRSAPVRIVFLHVPPGNTKGWHGEEEVRRLLIPLLNEGGVDLMLCGHYHGYSYTTDKSRGTDFPILINSNKDKVVVNADAKSITAQVVNTSGKVIHEHKINIKR